MRAETASMLRRRLWLVAAVALAAAVGVTVGELGGRVEPAPLDDTTRWSVHHDLDAATAVATAPDGGVWVGTRAAGLVRWDADGESYRRHLAERLEGRSVVDVAVSGDGVVWAATRSAGWPLVSEGARDGARIVRYDDGAATTHTHADGLPDARVSALAIDDDDTLWAGTDVGVVRFDGQRWRSVPEGPGGRVDWLAVDDDGAVWTAMRTDRRVGDGDDQNARPGGRVARFDGDAWRAWRAGGALPAGAVTALAAGGDGSVWVAIIEPPTESGQTSRPSLVRFTGQGWAPRDGGAALSDAPLRSLAVDDDGTVWTPFLDPGARDGAPQGGVARRGDGQWVTHTRDDGLPHGVVRSVTVDRHGAVWAVTAHGVARWAGDRWVARTTGEGPIAERIASVRTGDEAAWAASPAGVSRFDGQQWTSWHVGRQLAGPPTSVAMAVGPDGDVWYARDGVWRFDGDEWTQPLAGEGDQRRVTAVTVAGDGTVWTGTSPGDTPGGQPRVTRHDGDQRTVYTPDDGLAHGEVLQLATGRGDTLWVATDSGVSRFDGQQWTTYTPDDGLPSYEVTAVAASAHRDAVWAATSDGLARFDGQQWVSAGAEGDPLHLAADAALANEAVETIALDQRGNLWAVVDDEVARFDGRAWAGPVDVPAQNVLAIATADDAVWLATRTGAVRFDRR